GHLADRVAAAHRAGDRGRHGLRAVLDVPGARGDAFWATVPRRDRAGGIAHRRDDHVLGRRADRRARVAGAGDILPVLGPRRAAVDRHRADAGRRAHAASRAARRPRPGRVLAVVGAAGRRAPGLVGPRVRATGAPPGAGAGYRPGGVRRAGGAVRRVPGGRLRRAGDRPGRQRLVVRRLAAGAAFPADGGEPDADRAPAADAGLGGARPGGGG